MSTEQIENFEKISRDLLLYYRAKKKSVLARRIGWSPDAVRRWYQRGSIPVNELLLQHPHLKPVLEGRWDGVPLSVDEIKKLDDPNTEHTEQEALLVKTPQPIKDAIAVLGALLGPDSRPLQLSDESVQAILKVLELVSKEARKALDQQSSPQ